MRHPAVSIPIAMPTTAMAASRSAPSPSRARSIGLGETGASPANCACQAPPPSFASRRAPACRSHSKKLT
jgi:hypothetical protein